MVNGTWILLISPTFWEKKHIFQMLESPRLKLWGWCVNTKSFFYVSDPNMKCLKAKWNHLVSCFDPHSHVLTKLFYVCHIFVWPCNLSLVGPICGPSMLVTCVKHNKTYEKWISGYAHQKQMTHQFMYEPYDKSWS
jgi:hypothetical protein